MGLQASLELGGEVGAFVMDLAQLAGGTADVISSTVHNEIVSEPTVVVVPVFETGPDAGSASRS